MIVFAPLNRRRRQELPAWRGGSGTNRRGARVPVVSNRSRKDDFLHFAFIENCALPDDAIKLLNGPFFR